MSCKWAVTIVSSFITLFVAQSARAEDPCICPQVYEPVCGLNEQRYDNECEARCAGTFAKPDGAVIEILDRRGEKISFWVDNNDAFIDEAIAVLNGEQDQRVPFMADLDYGEFMCSEPEFWYPLPTQIEWRNKSRRKCDVTLKRIRNNLHDYMERVDAWCPSDAILLNVFDNRQEDS